MFSRKNIEVRFEDKKTVVYVALVCDGETKGVGYYTYMDMNRLYRTCVYTDKSAGRMLASEAEARDFFVSKRRKLWKSAR